MTAEPADAEHMDWWPRPTCRPNRILALKAGSPNTPGAIVKNRPDRPTYLWDRKDDLLKKPKLYAHLNPIPTGVWQPRPTGYRFSAGRTHSLLCTTSIPLWLWQSYRFRMAHDMATAEDRVLMRGTASPACPQAICGHQPDSATQNDCDAHSSAGPEKR
jgi:hypothetical protein